MQLLLKVLFGLDLQRTMKGDLFVCVWLLALYCQLAVKVQLASSSTGGDEYNPRDLEEGASDYCTRSEAGLTTDQLKRWITSVSVESNRTYITPDGGSTVFTAKSVNQAEDAFLSGAPSKVTEVWMNNSPSLAICVQKLVQKYQKKPPKIHISHLYSPGEQAKRCLAKMVKLKFKIDAIDWMSLSKQFTNVQCRNLVKQATGSQKFNNAMENLTQQLKEVQQYSKDPNVMKYCTV